MNSEALEMAIHAKLQADIAIFIHQDCQTEPVSIVATPLDE